MKCHLIGQALCGLALFLIQTAAQAGAFSVNPVRLTLSAQEPVAALTLRNAGSEPTLVQIETTRWSQEQGQDVTVTSNEILATPPIVTIPAGGSQIIRVGLRRAPDAKSELTYRLILREVPPPDADVRGLRITLHVSMPVFVRPASTVAPVLAWRAKLTREGQIRLEARNSGNAHVQLGKLELSDAKSGHAVGVQETAAYVLPANYRTWLVNTKSAPAVGTLLRVSSQTDAGKVQTDVALENDTAELSPSAPATAAR